MRSKILVMAHAMLITMVLVFSVAAHAEKHDLLTPLLVDLNGWKGEKAEGMSMDMGNMKMITATRNYTRGDKDVTAVVFIGNSAMTQGKMQGMKMESADSRINIKEIDGFQTQSVYDKKDKSGSVVIFLSHGEASGTIFTLSYNNIEEDKAIELAKKFDWKKMKATVEKLR